MADAILKESIYDEKGNIKIPAETIIEKQAMELAQKGLQITQLQTAIEILQKELQSFQTPVK